ncbi:MAG: methyltransferase domain-containing protein [Eggerthellaceae bacterium]|nr:methyltransferase domain-containing protein [Eggerthellaceae bacterium]
MNIATAKEQIKDTVEAYLQKDDAGMYVISPSRQRPMFLVGAPGIGKTAIIEQIAQELQIGVVSYSMTHHTRQSALGLPRIVHREYDGFEYEASEYTMSEIVSAVYDYMERTGLDRGILFLDEINCVSETLYPSMLQFLQFKTFGRHKVPEDWIIVCAGNPPEYNKSVHEFDIVTLDRLREIDVEPDYGAWKRYASEKGIHPAVTTFLEAKPDCFYNVESKPGGGKSFVTARGWEDLAEVITLYERLGKKCDRELFVQFLRDDDIADRFSVYYSLFDKYRSDYQIGRILAGDATSEITDRAKAAEFDERVALLGLILDALSAQCSRALDQEGVVIELRDMLREAKPKLLDGGTVDDAIVVPMQAREAALARKVAAGTAKQAYQRKERLVIGKLKDVIAACGLARTEEGPAAFETVNATYREQVDAIQPLVAEADSSMTSAFRFIETCFGNSREMLVFMAELSTRESTTRFIAHYGNEQYYAHNDELQVDASRKTLSDRVKELAEIENASNEWEPAFDTSLPIAERVENYAAATLGVDASGSAGIRRPGDAAKSGAALKENALAEYYHGKQFEYGFASMSRMTLPGLKGMRVLNVCCRRGKGVYKMSSMVGAEGRVIGTDWSASYIADAKDGEQAALRKNHLKSSNMEFYVAYPEKLIEAGIGDNSVDVVYINNVMTLVYDEEACLREFYRVLKPGGLLICETIFASAERDESVVEKARTIGNSIQAARTAGEFHEKLAAAGFGEPEVVDEFEVDANQGFVASKTVEAIETDEDVTFSAVAINVRKPA